MDKLNCDVLLTVVETGSFKKAADVLGYTQAGISYIINALEEEVGLRLFYREHGGVKLTSEGATLLPLIQQIHTAERNFKDKVNDMKGLDAGKVRVSAFNSAYIHLLPKIIRSFKEEYPGIDVEVVSCEDNKANEQLIFSRDVDCGFLPEVPALDIDFYDLMDDPYMVAVSKDHAFADRDTYPVKKIYDESYIMIAFDKADFYDKLFPDGKRPKPSFVADNELAALSMISENLGVGIFSHLLKENAPYPVRFIPLDPPVTRTVGIGVRSMKTCTNAARRFIEHVRNSMHNISY
ncbi:MAG: LysR family transcriptional regulator [Bacillota bacterium]|nr:LysR family transcriptional regulator [Bacillota bacterium]